MYLSGNSEAPAPVSTHIYSNSQSNTMYTGIQHLHSFLSYLVIGGLAVSIILALVGQFSGRPFTGRDRKLALIGLIPAHLQWIVGLVLYFISPMGLSSLSVEAMGNSLMRLYTLEHPVMMILAVVLITIGFALAKRGSDPKKQFRSIWVFYLVGLIFILSRIPWAAWP
jgi:hypothetical protein